jgi:hypothetical protein
MDSCCLPAESFHPDTQFFAQIGAIAGFFKPDLSFLVDHADERDAVEAIVLGKAIIAMEGSWQSLFFHVGFGFAGIAFPDVYRKHFHALRFFFFRPFIKTGIAERQGPHQWPKNPGSRSTFLIDQRCIAFSIAQFHI